MTLQHIIRRTMQQEIMTDVCGCSHSSSSWSFPRVWILESRRFDSISQKSGLMLTDPQTRMKNVNGHFLSVLTFKQQSSIPNVSFSFYNLACIRLQYSYNLICHICKAEKLQCSTESGSHLLFFMKYIYDSFVKVHVFDLVLFGDILLRKY